MSAAVDHFEALYRADADPWRVATAWYERRKRAVLLAALPQDTYSMALELGCGNGEATRLLAGRCEQLHAVDSSPSALAACRQRLAEDGIDNVTVHTLRLPEQWPVADGVDLIVVSELAYYFDDADLARFATRVAESLRPGGHLLMCHWQGSFDDRRQDTAHAHTAVASAAALKTLVAHREEAFQLDVWVRPMETGT